MFDQKKTVIFLTKSKARISKVTLGNKPKEAIIADLDVKQDLASSLFKFSKAIGNRVRLVLSEDFTYVIALSFPKGRIINLDLIKQKAQELIPENINETVWNYKEIPSASLETKKMQVVVVVKKLFEDLNNVFLELGLYAEKIEPLSLSLARIFKNQDESILLVYIYDKVYSILSQKNLVLATEQINLPLTKDKLNKFIEFAKEKFEVVPQKIIFCGETKDLNLKEYEFGEIKAEIQDLSPAISLAYKKSAGDDNHQELNLQFKKVVKKHDAKLLKIGIIALMIVIIFEIFFYFV